LTRDSLAVAVEALSWMAYSGIGERAALLKASEEIGVIDERALRDAHRLIMESSRFQNRLDWIISQDAYSSKLENAPHGIRSLLRIIAYSKFIQPKTFPELERIAEWGRQTLGWREVFPYEESIARLTSSKMAPPIFRLPDVERTAMESCHPEWYVERVTLAFGRTVGLKMLRRDLSPVRTFARINGLKMQDATNSQSMQELVSSKVQGLDGVFSFDHGKSANQRELALSGKIVIQDLGSIVAGMVASPRPRQVVLDVCASPGNKSSHLADEMHNEGEIYSVELSVSRMRQWRKEMLRTGCSIATLIRADARSLPLRNSADVVVVDPPCSNSGVFARNPASKWRVTPARLRELIHYQARILQSASERLVEGGTLVYCTCSILPEENEAVVETFLRKNSQFTLLPQHPFVGSPGLRGLTSCQRFYPYLHDCNGYFIARMQKS